MYIVYQKIANGYYRRFLMTDDYLYAVEVASNITGGYVES